MHIAVMLWGFTAILGDLISVSAFVLVWWRVAITSISFLLSRQIWVELRRLSWRQKFNFFVVGAIIALHWASFFGAIKYANASIALVALSTSPLMTSLIEPLILGHKVSKVDIWIGLIVIPLMVLILSDLSGRFVTGFGIGLVSSFLGALFTVLNKKLIDQTDPYTITFLELSSAWLFMTIILPVVLLLGGPISFWPVGIDWFYLIVLALLCTSFTFILHLKALEHISAFSANLILLLEPVYGIVLAAIILHEYQDMSPGFYMGMVVLIGLITTYPFLKKKYLSMQKEEQIL